MRHWISAVLADLREVLELIKEIRAELEAITELLGQIDPGHNAPGLRFSIGTAQPK